MAPQNRLKGSDEAAGFLADLIRHLRLFWRLLNDPRVPAWVKIIPAVVLLYLIFPLDLIPDLALGLGQLDDLAVILVGLKLFHDLSPSAVVREHEASLTGKSSPWRVVEDESALDQPPTIDAEYRVLDE
jgi:uncharacterized membrane protein YkvA (DUF1232 family)